MCAGSDISSILCITFSTMPAQISTPDIIGGFKGLRIPVITARNASTLPMLDNWKCRRPAHQAWGLLFWTLPADDLIAPQGIKKMVAIGEEYPEVGIIGCQEWAGGVVLGTDLPSDRCLYDGRQSCAVRCLMTYMAFHICTAFTAFRKRACRSRSTKPNFTVVAYLRSIWMQQCEPSPRDATPMSTSHS